jgi:hypothetical protein
VDDELALELEELLAVELPVLVALPPPPVVEPLEGVFVRPEPVLVPLMLVPDVPVPLSCWPTVRFTVATVPSMGAVNVAPDNDVWALASWAWADVTFA